MELKQGGEPAAKSGIVVGSLITVIGGLLLAAVLWGVAWVSTRQSPLVAEVITIDEFRGEFDLVFQKIRLYHFNAMPVKVVEVRICAKSGEIVKQHIDPPVPTRFVDRCIIVGSHSSGREVLVFPRRPLTITVMATEALEVEGWAGDQKVEPHNQQMELLEALAPLMKLWPSRGR